MSNKDDADIFNIELEKKTLINVIYTSLNGNEICTLPNGTKIALFSAFLKLDGGVLLTSDVISGQNNNLWVGYVEPGKHVFEISTDWEETCPGEYEIQIFVANEAPNTITENGISYTYKVYNGLDADPAFDVNSVSGVSPAEAAALKSIYNDYGGSEWYDARGWLASPDVCYWTGMNCDRAGLSSLNLPYLRHLPKPLEAEILEALPNLREFRIEGANFQQFPLPDAFANWKNISMLQVIYSNVAGGLPISIADKKKLWFINFEGNNFSGSIPAEWAEITNLKHLSLTGNKLSGAIPEEFIKLNQLRTFYFDTDSVCVPNQEMMAWLDGLADVSPGYRLCEATPTKNLDMDNFITIYPNPSSEVLQISISNPQLTFNKIILYDVTGKAALQSTELQANISGLPEGMYVAEIHLDEGVVNKSVVIKH